MSLQTKNTVLAILLFFCHPIVEGFQTIPLETERLFLRAASITDVQELAEIALNPEVTKRTGIFPHLNSLDDVASFVRTYLIGNSTLNIAPRYPNAWIIIEKKSQRILGLVLFVAYLERHQRAEIAYALLPSCWNNGYATEACQAVIGYGFSQGIFRIYATVDSENGASERVLQKIHMTFEGLLHSYMIVNGHHVDRKMYAIIAGN